jgi:AraC-like DNA-binding protein
MKKATQFTTLVIEDIEQTALDAPSEHGHNFYEIVYIMWGEGVHVINKVGLPYRSGTLFLLSPEDEHFFQISAPTRFAIIRFTDHYFTQKRHLTSDQSLVRRPEELMRNKFLKERVLFFDTTCSNILQNTIDNILSYKCKQDLSTSAIVFYQILTILGMVREEISRADATLTNEVPVKEHLLTYIHKHIYQPQLVQIKEIASHFNISPNYFSTFFKKNFGMTYLEYVHGYKIGLIEKRIASGETNFKQIAIEFGFTDESHLTNFFKQKKNINPASFRKKTMSR